MNSLYISNICVFSDSSVAIKSGGCFTGSGHVKLDTGKEIRMAELEVGQRLLSMRSTGELEFSEVIAFLDRDKEASSVFYTIYCDGHRSITLTAKHLIYVYNVQQANTSSSTAVVADISITQDSLRAVYAEDVHTGQYLLLAGSSDLSAPVPSRVRLITMRKERGVYAPLTKHGTIVVDGVVASCYAYINSVAIAHAVFAPMRAVHTMTDYIPFTSWTTSSDKDAEVQKAQHSVGIHWYAQLLYRVGTVLLNEDLLYIT
jgi:hypothetical protein